MSAAAVVYALGGQHHQIFAAVTITVMNMLGLICDPIAGLVEVPCVKRNASGAVIAFAAAQMALADYDPVIPTDEVVDVMGEVGNSMDAKYKETAMGGLAATPTGREITARILKNPSQSIAEEE
jgi:L-serine dehydratase